MSLHSVEKLRWRRFEWRGSYGETCTLALVAGDGGLREIRFDGVAPAACVLDERDALLNETAAQLARYFEGELRAFDLPLDMRGTEFQKQVWSELLAIPYGETRSYMDVARTIGRPKAVRAVGAANGQNPIPIVVPCHRVIGASGKLVGFGGGLEMKRLLLGLESSAYGFWA